MTQRILIVEDEDLFARSVATRLARDGHECAIASSLANARDALADPVDLLLLDMRLPDGSGLDFLGEKPAPPAIMITAFGDIENAVTAMKRGAVDYLRKPIDLDELAIVVDRTLATRQMETRLAYSRERDTHRSGGSELLGKSPAIGKVRREIAAFAAPGGGVGAPPVLILGETGSGKNVAAHLIHDCRLGADRPLVHIDCASLARGTPTPELFGDDRGPGLDRGRGRRNGVARRGLGPRAGRAGRSAERRRAAPASPDRRPPRNSRRRIVRRHVQPRPAGPRPRRCFPPGPLSSARHAPPGDAAAARLRRRRG